MRESPGPRPGTSIHERPSTPYMMKTFRLVLPKMVKMARIQDHENVREDKGVFREK